MKKQTRKVKSIIIVGRDDKGTEVKIKGIKRSTYPPLKINK